MLKLTTTLENGAQTSKTVIVLEQAELEQLVLEGRVATSPEVIDALLITVTPAGEDSTAFTLALAEVIQADLSIKAEDVWRLDYREDGS